MFLEVVYSVENFLNIVYVERSRHTFDMRLLLIAPVKDIGKRSWLSVSSKVVSTVE